MKYLIVLFCCSLLFITSCMMHRHTVGNGPIGNDRNVVVFSQGTEVYIGWGAISLGRPVLDLPSHGNYQIKTAANIVDKLVDFFTFGFVSSRTIQILVYRDEPIYPADSPINRSDNY